MFESSRVRERVKMNTDTATDETNSNKRAKIDLNVVSTSTPPSDSKTPKSVAQEFITAHVESLHFHVAAILKKTSFAHVNLVHKLLNKINQKSKMELDPSLIPRSARLDFTLKSSKKVEELPDYIKLQEETNIYILAVKENLKARILLTTEMEIKSLRQEILEHFVKGIFLIAKTIKTGEGEPTANIHGIVSEIIHQHHEYVLPHFDCDLPTFINTYKELLNVTTFPAQTTTATDATTSQEVVVHSQYFRPAGCTNPEASATPPVLTLDTSNIYRTIQCLFMTSVERYRSQVKRNEININLQKLDINHLTEAATAQVEMEVGNEPSVTPENLKELVAKESKKVNESLQKEITKLKLQVNNLKSSKNEIGARTKRGALPKKSALKQVSFASQAAQKAGGVDKDSRKKKGKKTSEKSKKTTTKSSRKSSTKKHS